ncbi:MAG TPA: DNA polymerase III subunit delta' [Xanthobacteraceae bacterium]|nr:DNA polymerase III subunit delta' [Xanthobacteraceae bacterium]
MTQSEDEDSDPPPPRETTALFGHADAEREFLIAYRSGRVPHAWLIGGERGIGKATLAYRIARFVLAYPDPSRVPTATSLALDPAHPTVRRVAVNAHPDLLALERTVGDNGKMRTVITVDQVRRLAAFFGSTAGEGGWRVCIADSADELKYPEGANALLKVLEEPPPRSLLLLVSHAPGRLLPTIRSRCRRLTLKPLGQGDVASAAATALETEADDPAIVKAAAAARGSVSRAIALVGGPMLVLREKVGELLTALPSTDPQALHAIGDQLDRDRGLLDVFVGAIRDWLSARLDAATNPEQLARVAELWDRLDRSARDVEIYNLERKPLVFAVFGLLAEASRG